MPTVTGQFPRALALTPTAFTVPMILASQSYTVDFTWNNRSNGDKGAWFATWKRSDGAVVFSGKKIVLTDDFFEPFHHLADVPPGRLQIRRADNSPADPGLKDLAGAVLFEYIT